VCDIATYRDGWNRRILNFTQLRDNELIQVYQM